ncbi:MAG: hypothetical protein BroJett015_19700 [Chloroflexota bacterium]|nr:hypothetical protein [Ardenticatenaceae bacterium]GIK56307.1 MAG: hypothetical protein BroJett015_19700 [Chloroflexota bacterium]
MFASSTLKTPCLNKRTIPRFANEQQVKTGGFNFQVTPPGGSYAFYEDDGRPYLALRMVPFIFHGELSSSRISEIDTSRPLDQRVYCWQPTPTANVVVTYTHRFAEIAPPPGLSENLFLWNARLSSDKGVTAVGVTRSHLYNGYFAIVAQDFNFAARTGLLQLTPLPVWINATKWHTVHIVMSQETATLQIEQDDRQATVLQMPFLHPPDPLGFEFSLDNEIAPESIHPVTVADQLDIAFYHAELQQK